MPSVFRTLLLTALALVAAATTAVAQSYPNRPICWYVGFHRATRLRQRDQGDRRQARLTRLLLRVSLRTHKGSGISFMNRSRLIVAVSLAVQIAIVTAANAQIVLLGPTEWPTTIQDTVRDILSRMSAAEKAGFRRMKSEQIILQHHGWGTGIRNRYGLWRGNDKLMLSACGYPCHPDDASGKIMEAVWQELRK